MTFNVIAYTLFLFVMFMFFPSLLYAWTKDDPPIKPPDDMELDCSNWIKYNGFKLDGYPYNRDKAVNRDVTLDKKASTWAAMYAFKIGGLQDIYQMSPEEFCSSLGGDNNVPKKFVALKKQETNCKGWINLYGFKDTIYDNYNNNYILNIDPLKVQYISIWAYSYYIYLMFCEEDDRMQPVELCMNMGSRGDYSDPKKLICKHDASLTCQDWILQYDYTLYHGPLYNAYKSEHLMKNKLKYPLIHIHYFPRTYAKELLDLLNYGKPVNLTIMDFCKTYDGDGEEPEKYGFNFPEEE